MHRLLTFRRLSILFVSLFALALVAMFSWQFLYVSPSEKCEQSGRWWWAEQRECVTPLYLPDITGRKAGESRADASNRANQDLIGIEEKLKAEEAARRAQTERDRKRVEKSGI